jgi:hypothetical protein
VTPLQCRNRGRYGPFLELLYSAVPGLDISQRSLHRKLFAIFVDNDEKSFRLTHGSHLEEYAALSLHAVIVTNFRP